MITDASCDERITRSAEINSLTTCNSAPRGQCALVSHVYAGLHARSNRLSRFLTTFLFSESSRVYGVLGDGFLDNNLILLTYFHDQFRPWCHLHRWPYNLLRNCSILAILDVSCIGRIHAILKRKLHYFDLL